MHQATEVRQVQAPQRRKWWYWVLVVVFGVLGIGFGLAIFGMLTVQFGFLGAILYCVGVYYWQRHQTRAIPDDYYDTLRSPLMRAPYVVDFYECTRRAWAQGTLATLGQGYATEGKLPQPDFVKRYVPTEGSALRVFFENFPPPDGEFMIGVGNLQSGRDRGWFVLTNRRLMQRDGRDNVFKTMPLASIARYEINEATKSLHFTLKSGEHVAFAQVQMWPKADVITAVLAQFA